MRSSFLAVHLDLPSEDDCLAILTELSPRFMRWDQTLWLVDLTACFTYWHRCAELKQQTIETLFSSILKRGQNEAYMCAVLGANPWQALLVLNAMLERDLQGMTVMGPFGQKILKETSWEAWWQLAEQAAVFLKHDKLSSAKKRMQRAMERLGLKRPWQLHTTEASAIKRRFGTLLSQLWAWTFRDQIYDFPWQSYAPPAPIVVRRDLDAPLCEWTHLEALLIEDFNTFLKTRLSPDDRITSIAWELIRDDLTTITIRIGFRHPHSLDKEKPEQKTAALQARYAFEAQMRLENEHLAERGVDDILFVPPIISWRLSIEERLRLPSFLCSLFGDDQADLVKLIELENLLPMPLIMTRSLTAEWVPEDSFLTGEPIVEPRSSPDSSMDFPTPGHAASAHCRPLFVFHKPLPPTSEQTSERLRSFVFLERIGSKWWRADHNEPRRTGRDYYVVTDDHKRRFWAYREHHVPQTGLPQPDEWHLHGLFA